MVRGNIWEKRDGGWKEGGWGGEGDIGRDKSLGYLMIIAK